MLYRRVGKTEVKVSTISLGVWSLAHKVWNNTDGESQVANVIAAAIDNGITTIDTAPTYGIGWCDELIGKTIRGKRNKIQISTKYGQRWDSLEGIFSFDILSPHGQAVRIMRNSKPASIVEECEQSLLRLQTDYIDIYQCHWPDPATPMADSMEAIDILLRFPTLATRRMRPRKSITGSLSIAEQDSFRHVNHFRARRNSNPQHLA